MMRRSVVAGSTGREEKRRDEKRKCEALVNGGTLAKHTCRSHYLWRERGLRLAH